MPRSKSIQLNKQISTSLVRKRGRPPKSEKSLSFETAGNTAVKKRGRPPKIKVTELPKKKEVIQEVKTPQEKLIESHCFYPAAQWIENNIDNMEEAYLRKTSKKHGLSMTHNIMDHMLGYFSIRGSELGKAIRESKKHT